MKKIKLLLMSFGIPLIIYALTVALLFWRTVPMYTGTYPGGPTKPIPTEVYLFIIVMLVVPLIFGYLLYRSFERILKDKELDKPLEPQ